MIMLPIDKLHAVRKVITHDKCPDGIASAMILRDAFAITPIEFHQYDTKEYLALAAEPGLLFCDITPPSDRTDEFVAAGAIVLDHHRTARACVAKFGDLGVFGDEATEPGLSGALLAYRHVWLPLRGDEEDDHSKGMIEKFAVLAGIRDTWQKQSPQWAEAVTQAYALMFPPQEYMVEKFSRLTCLLGADWNRYLWAGRIREKSFSHACARAVKNGFRFITTHGIRVIVFQGAKLASDAAEIAMDRDLVMAYGLFCEGNRPKLVFSLCSQTNFDCAQLALHMGGGGHTKAAGFSMWDPKGSPFQVAEQVLQEYELSAY